MDSVLRTLNFIKSLGYQAFREVPDAAPAEFVTVVLDGGGMLTERISQPMLTVECYAPDMKRAREIAFDIAAKCVRMTREVRQVFSVDVNSVYPDPDPDTHAPAYAITLALTVSD